jgi:hypothetical protein
LSSDFVKAGFLALIFSKLKHWIESDPAVPDGKWFKRFKSGFLAGNGECVSTFLESGMAVEGDEAL